MPVAEAAAGRILSLPLSPTMGFEQVERVGSVLQRAER
jgi:dTDP-4-amino-4,6-dideoxygalactose transaminase